VEREGEKMGFEGKRGYFVQARDQWWMSPGPIWQCLADDVDEGIITIVR
jgi:hypothetical protein